MESRRCLVIALAKLGHKEEAEEVLRELEVEGSMEAAVERFEGGFHATRHREAGNSAARQFKFKEAASHFEKLVAMPEAHTTSTDFHRYGALLVQLENRTAHDALAKKAAERFEDSRAPSDLDRAAKIYFLLPPTAGQPSGPRDRALAMIERCMKLPGIEEHQGIACFSATRGMAAHRLGAREDVEKWMETAIAAQKGPVVDVLSLAFRAMSRSQDGRVSEAKSDLEEAKHLYEKLGFHPSKVAPSDWPNKLIARIALKEAMELIDGNSKALGELGAEK